MSIIIIHTKDFDKPCNCMECPFLSELTYHCIDHKKSLFKEYGYCKFAREFSNKEDVTHDSYWLLHNTEPWCPIEEVKE